MSYKLGVIGVGNMANAILAGIVHSDVAVSEIYVYDKNECQYSALKNIGCNHFACESVKELVQSSDCILLAVKPQNFPEILEQISFADNHAQKLYITIAAGISSKSVSEVLNNAKVIRVLPNLPMTVGLGVSVICRNTSVSKEDFSFVTSLFESSGSTMIIDENEMNRIIGVTSSSPAYVFKFINAIYQSALAQGLSDDGLLGAVCDVFIGSATLLKQSNETPDTLIQRVCSKGGTTERAIMSLNDADIDTAIHNAMTACTQRADELGNKK